MDTSGKLLTALFTCKPTDSTSVDITALQKDSETLVAWLKCLGAGVGYLTSLAVDNHTEESGVLASHVAAEHLELLIKTALNIVVNNPLPDVRDTVRRLIVNVIFSHLVWLLLYSLLLISFRIVPQ